MEAHVTLPRAESAQRYAGEQMWCEDTFYVLPTTHATEWPYAAALQDAGETLTWGKLNPWTCSVAANLREYGWSAETAR